MARRSLLAPAIVALAVAAASLTAAPSSSFPPINPMGAQSVFTPTEPEYVAIIEPLLRAPWRGDRTLAAGALVAFAAAAALVWVAQKLHASLVAVSCVATALFFSAPFSASARYGAETVVAATLLWISWGVILRQVPNGSGGCRQVPTRSDGFRQVHRFDHRRARDRAVLSVAVWACAVTASWMAILTLPLAMASATRSARTWRAQVIAALGTASVGIACVALFFVRVASWAGGPLTNGAPSIGGEMSWWNVGRVAFSIAPLHVAPTLPAPGGEPGFLLPLALVLAATAFSPNPAWLRVSVALMLALTGVLWLEWPGWRGVLLRWSAWVMTPFVAVGLTWVSSQARPRWRLATTLGIGAILAASPLLATIRPQGREMQRFRDWLEARHQIAAGAATDVQFVSEDVLVDSALVAWGTVRRVPQSSAAIANAHERGTTLLAGPSARRHLELLGVRFVTVAEIDDPVAYRLSTVRQQLRCASLRSDRWSVLPGLEYTGRVGLEIPPSDVGRLVLIVGDTLPVQLRASTEDGRSIPIAVQPLSSPPSPDAPPPEYWFEGGDPLAVPQQVIRAELTAPESRAALVNLHFGRRAPRVLARLLGHGDDARGRVCAAPHEIDWYWETDPVEEVDLPLRSAALFGRGWHGVEGTGVEVFRWSEGDGALLVPSARDGALRVLVEAAPAAEVQRDGPEITLSVNGIAEPPREMSPGSARYAWAVDGSRWVRGTNELLLSVSRTVRPADQGRQDTRVLGLRVSRITLTPE